MTDLQDDVTVTLSHGTAQALASALLSPVKDLHDRTIYALSVTLGGELRKALAGGMSPSAPKEK
jgi:hypothetical protein